jgi:hypothetical protein
MLLDQSLQVTGDTKFENRVEDQVIKKLCDGPRFFQQITLANCFGGFCPKNVECADQFEIKGPAYGY